MKKIIISILLILLSMSLYGESSLDKYIVDRKIGPDGSEIIGIKVPAGRPPQDYVRKEIIDIESLRTSRSVVIIDDVPAFDWSYGCSATSAAIVAAYYDRNGYPNIYTGPTNNGIMPLNNSFWNESSGGEGGDGECPLSATHQGFDGLTSRGHVDNYWIEYGSTTQDPYLTNGWTPHTNADCTGDFMGTNQSYWGNTDGMTNFYTYNSGAPLSNFSECESYNPPRKDGGYGFEQFMESRGYSVTSCFNQKIYGYEGNTQGFTFAQYMAEIDANRPVLINVTGHTMVGFGYDSSNQTMYIKNTWDYSTHTMTWGGTYEGMTHYGVVVMQLEASNIGLLGDSFSNPISVNSLPFTSSGNTNDYTNTIGNTSNDVIFQVYLSTAVDNAMISTDGSGFDTYLRLYNSSQSQIDYDDDDGEGNCSLLEGISFEANTPYFVCVEGFSSNNGNDELNISIPGDDFSSAIEISSLPFSDSGNTNNYTNTVGNPSNDVFYRINLPNAVNNVVITTDGSSYDTYLRLYNSSQNQIDYDDDDGEGTCSQLNGLSLNANTDYYICVEGFSSNNGEYSLNVTGDLLLISPNLSANKINDNDVYLQWNLGSRQEIQSITKSSNRIKASREQRALTGFKVYRNNSVIATLGLTYTYTDIYLANNSYNYKVTALYGLEESDPSNIVEITVNLGNPLIAENLEIIYDEGWIILAWDNVEFDSNNNPLTPDYYNIYASDTIDSDNYTIIGTATDNFFSIEAEDISFNPAFIKVTAVKEP